MNIQSLDLAAKYSALCRMGEDGFVLEEKSSWGITENEFIDLIVSPFSNKESNYGVPSVLLCEDLPHGVPFMKITKKVLRMQGRIVERMQQRGYGDRLIFVPPTVWQKYFGIVGKNSSKLVQPKAEELGYIPPISYTQYKGAERQLARKVSTDFSAAFLMCIWAFSFYRENGVWDAPTTSRYE